MEKFSSSAIEELGYYVYRLIDPRNGLTFYVGTGQGNKIFSHINATLNEEEEYLGIEIIRDIRRSGFEPIDLIHRHAMGEEVANEVKDTLINVFLPHEYESLIIHNETINAKELNDRYTRETMIPDPNHKLLYFEIYDKRDIYGRYAYDSLYDAARRGDEVFGWNINTKKAKEADYVIAVEENIVVGVFKVDKWKPSNPNGWHFEGSEVQDKEILEKYVGKLVPKKYQTDITKLLLGEDKTGKEVVHYGY